MRRPACSPPTPVPPRALDGLVDRLVTAHHAAPGPPTFVRVRRGPGATIDLATAPAPDAVHPADALVGTTLPASWWASGVVVSGRAWRDAVVDVGGVSARAAREAEPTPVSVGVLVDRSGRVTHRVAGIGEVDEAPEGRMVDLLRRSLRLPTDPPRTPVAAWWRALWLDRVVSAAAWEPGSGGSGTDVVADLGIALVAALVDDPAPCAVEGWGDLRRLAAGPPPPSASGRAAIRAALVELVAPDHAAWMDDGCFSRWLLAGLPPVAELLDLVDVLLPPAQARRVHDVVGPLDSDDPAARFRRAPATGR